MHTCLPCVPEVLCSLDLPLCCLEKHEADGQVNVNNSAGTSLTSNVKGGLAGIEVFARYREPVNGGIVSFVFDFEMVERSDSMGRIAECK